MKDMYAVSEAINGLDTALNKSDTKSTGVTSQKWKCLKGDDNADPNGLGQCAKGNSSSTHWRSLKDAFSGKSADKAIVDAKSAEHISERMTSSDFTREDRGKISSAFAKAHEGAEIVRYVLYL